MKGCVVYKYDDRFFCTAGGKFCSGFDRNRIGVATSDDCKFRCAEYAEYERNKGRKCFQELVIKK